MEEYWDLKFGNLRRYISVIDRISICMHETLQYENYRLIREVPELYDDYYVYGVGMIESEFSENDNYPDKNTHYKKDESMCAMQVPITLKMCIEIMLAQTPRDMYPPEDWSSVKI